MKLVDNKRLTAPPNKKGMVWSKIVPSWTKTNIIMPSIEQAMHITPTECGLTQNSNAIDTVAPPTTQEQIHNASR